MTRSRVASVLAVVATLCVVGTAVAAGTAYLRQPGPEPPDRPARTLTVTDPRSGASFRVPAGAWRVEGRDVRVYYTDRRGRPAAVVRGPAVFRAGYCRARPRGSNRAFAGFTREGFGAWVHGLTRGRGTWTTGAERESVELEDGTRARLTRASLMVGGDAPCSAPGVEVAMVEAAGVRVVLVRDDGVADGLAREDVRAILGSLRLP